MTRIIFVIFIYIISANRIYSQFTKPQIDELTASGIYYALEPSDDKVIQQTREITEKYAGEYNIKQVCTIFDYLRRNWNYSSDPEGLEYFEKASVSIYTLTGDCDDYSTLLVSMIKSLGGDGRIVCVSGHAYPELYLGDNLVQADFDGYLVKINEYFKEKGSRFKAKYLYYHRDYDNSVWLNLDYQDRYPGGQFLEDSPDAEHLVIYSNGSYRLSYLNNDEDTP